MIRLKDISQQPRAAAWMALLLAAATCGLFFPALKYGYVNYDDSMYIYENPQVLRGLTGSGLAYAFQTVTGSNWMPVTWISYLLDMTVFGPGPTGPHLTNILLHAASVALLFLVLHRMTQSFWRSALVAAWFAWHPLRIESVVWVAERKDVLSLFFGMLGVLAYARYVERPGWKRFLPVVICLVLGLMAKATLVTFPLLLLLLDFWPLRRLGATPEEWRRRIGPLLWEKIPLLLPALIMCGVAYWAQRHTGAIATVPVTPGERWFRVAADYWFYLQKSFWPVPLSILYEIKPLVYGRLTLEIAVMAGLTALVLRFAIRLPWLATGWLWFLIALAPISGIVRLGHITVADRYSYLPSVGLGIALAWGAGALAHRWPRLRPAVVGGGLVILVAAMAVTRLNLPRWQSSITLFESALRYGNHEVAYDNLGAAYNEARDFGRAINLSDEGLQLYPASPNLYTHRGLARFLQGDATNAIKDFDTSIALNPDASKPYDNRGNAYLRLRQFDLALADFNRAVAQDPNNASAYNNRANARIELHDFINAVADCNRALELNPQFADAYNNRATASNRQGQPAAALPDYNQAIRLNPLDPIYFNNRAAALYQLGDFARAWADIQTCRKLGGTPVPALVNLVTAALQRGQ